MSKFISLNIEDRGLLQVDDLQIINQKKTSSNQISQTHANKFIQKLEETQKKIITLNNLKKINNEYIKIRSKLRKYATTSCDHIQKLLDGQENTRSLIKNQTKKIYIDQKYCNPITNKVNHIEEIIKTQEFKRKTKLCINNYFEVQHFQKQLLSGSKYKKIQIRDDKKDILLESRVALIKKTKKSYQKTKPSQKLRTLPFFYN